MTHDELKSKYKDCSLCGKCMNTRKVFGSGNLSAKIAVVGEGPGKDEVEASTPFVGASGQLLNKILAQINLKREDLFFTNAILCRTSDKNRTPDREEYRNCRTRLFEELSIVQPMFTLLVGSIALKTIFGEDYRVTDCHGQWFTLGAYPCFWYYSLLHPAWILHSDSDAEAKSKKITMLKDVNKFAEERQLIQHSFYI